MKERVLLIAVAGTMSTQIARLCQSNSCFVLHGETFADIMVCSALAVMERHALGKTHSIKFSWGPDRVGFLASSFVIF